MRGAGEPDQNCVYTLLLVSSNPECVSFIQTTVQRGLVNYINYVHK